MGAGMVVVVVTAVFAFVMVVVDISREIVVAALSCVVVTGFVFEVSSNKFGEAQSHFTRKCKVRVDQEEMAAGEFFSRFSYYSSASKSDLQQL